MSTLRRLASTPTALDEWRWELRATFLLVGGIVGMLLAR